MCYSLRLICPGAFFLGALLSWSAVGAEESLPVEIRSVQFGTARDSWLQVDIELRGNRNPALTARNDRFVDRVKVHCILTYQFEDSFDFYKASQELVAIEQSKTRTVTFFLPGIIVKRDRLRGEPFAYLVELEVAGEALAIQEEGVSASIRNNPVAIHSLKSRAQLEGRRNDGILIPGYLAPVNLRDGQDTQGYVRIPPESR